jgi:hypothetical protein
LFFPSANFHFSLTLSISLSLSIAIVFMLYCHLDHFISPPKWHFMLV